MQNAKGHVAIILVQGQRNQGGQVGQEGQGPGDRVATGGPGILGDRGPSLDPSNC